MVTGLPEGTTELGSAQMMGLRKVPGRKSEAGSRGVPPQAPALSPDLPDSPPVTPSCPPPACSLGVTLSPREEGAGPLDRLTGLHLGPQAHTQSWKRVPCERSALSSEQCLSSPGASWALGSPEGAGWLGGSLQTRASPAPPHLTEAEQGGERGGHGVSSLQSRL